MRRAQTIRVAFAAAFCLLLVIALTGQGEEVVAVEIGKHNTNLLPKGKEADGIIGDFVLQNGSITALVSGNLPHRRANMSTEYRFPTPGCLFDLDLRGADNDQLTAFRPGDQGGELNWVRIASDGAGGSARVEAYRSAAKGDGLSVRHEYRLDRGWKHLLVTSVYRNESSEAVTLTPRPQWKGFSKEWTVGNTQVADAIDPFDKRAYAWAVTGNGPIPAEEEELAPGAEKTYHIVIAPGDSPATAHGVVASVNGDTGTVEGTAIAIHASIEFPIGGQTLPAYPDADGNFKVALAPGSYTAKFIDIGRDAIDMPVAVKKGKPTKLSFQLDPASAVRFAINDANGNPSPAKVQFLGRNGTPKPNFGTHYRAHGNDHQYQSHDGRFTQQTPPGDYLVRITRGPEHDLVEKEITVENGKTLDVSATLRRTVNTAGWISTDYHAHSTPSGDNYCKTDDRIINFAAEQLEFIPTTEHNRIYDWEPHIERLGLKQHLKTIVGIELTGRGQHFNSFPLQVVPYAQDGGAPRWQYDPRINAIVLRNLFEGGPERWVQANHPTVGYVFNDMDQDGIADGGFVSFEKMIDAAEVWSTEILSTEAFYEQVRGERRDMRENRTFGWLQMLNQGRHVWCVAVSDSHRIFGNGAGGWRTYVPSSTDAPPEIDHKEIIRNSKAGRMMISNGPFLEVETADGLPIGSNVISAGSIDLKVRVQTANWMDIDRVQILVNGRQRPRDNYTRASHSHMFRDGVVKFDQTLTVKLQEDAHLIVVAIDEDSTLERGWGGSWEATMHPIAYTSPIYVDVD
ncbi:MAG: CehA/McbA family metallohydrolase, partial [bacterium]|nr:CehA/McbA family metallohydrolase [bacterium]